MMVFKKKEILVSALVVLIGAAAVVNYSYNKNEAESLENIKNKEQIVSQAESYNVSATENEDENLTSNGNTEKMMGEAQQVTTDVKTENKDPFAAAKMSRESAKSKKLEILNGVCEDEASDSASRENARADIIKMAENADKESVCENLILAKGFEGAVVYIQDQSVTVTVKKEGFNQQDAVKVQDIVYANTGIETKYIKIVAV